MFFVPVFAKMAAWEPEMKPRMDDEPDDPRHFRRTLVPLEIEDAEGPPSLGRRFRTLFRKPNSRDGSEAEENRPCASSGARSEPADDDPNPQDGSGGDGNQDL